MSNDFSYVINVFLGGFILFFIIKKMITRPVKNPEWKKWIQEETASNFCTKKTMPSSILLTYDIHKIPQVTHPSCKSLYEQICHFENAPMANLSSYENKDLKKEFGINYFQTLIQYEETYQDFLKTLVKYAKELHTEGFIQESIDTLEYALTLGCDTVFCYSTLIENYVIMKDKEKLKHLAYTGPAAVSTHTLDKVKTLALAALEKC